MKSSTLLLLCVLLFTCGTRAFAAKEVFLRSKPHCNVGTIGQVNQGKSMLALALAQAANTAPEMEVWRVTDDEGTYLKTVEGLFFDMETDSRVYRVHDFEDEDTSLVMSQGTMAWDAALLVVAASDGPMPQTREHILLARQTKVPAVVVYLNLDGASPGAEADDAEAAVRKELFEAGFDGDAVIVVRGSATGALQGVRADLLALADLVDALDESASQR